MNYLSIIRNLREDNDYTQEYVAKILNVGQRTYADYELGKTRIPLDSMIKLAKLYNVDMNYICGISGVIRQIKRCLFRQIKTGLSERLTMG